MMTTQKQIIDVLPEEFTRREVLSYTLSKGYSISTANTVIEYGLMTNLIERINRGKYRKLTNRKSEIRNLYNEGLSYRQIAERLNISKSQVASCINNLDK